MGDQIDSRGTVKDREAKRRTRGRPQIADERQEVMSKFRLDDKVGCRYLDRPPRKGKKIIRPVYPVKMDLTRRLLRDCKLKAAVKRLVEEAFARIRRNHNATKREERHPDDREIVGQVIGAVLTSFEVYPLVEVPKDYDDPMCRDEGE